MHPWGNRGSLPQVPGASSHLLAVISTPAQENLRWCPHQDPFMLLIKPELGPVWSQLGALGALGVLCLAVFLGWTGLFFRGWGRFLSFVERRCSRFSLLWTNS